MPTTNHPDPNTDFQAALEQQLIRHENLKLKPYFCTSNKLSIGAGRNLEDNGISRSEAMLMLRNDLIATSFGLEKAVPGFLALTPRRRMALIDMAYNLGLAGFLKFRKLLTAIQVGDWQQASAEMLDSKWADQVGKASGQRAHTLATMMREG